MRKARDLPDSCRKSGRFFSPAPGLDDFGPWNFVSPAVIREKK
jgi:hypothetical protein